VLALVLVAAILLPLVATAAPLDKSDLAGYYTLAARYGSGKWFVPGMDYFAPSTLTLLPDGTALWIQSGNKAQAFAGREPEVYEGTFVLESDKLILTFEGEAAANSYQYANGVLCLRRPEGGDTVSEIFVRSTVPR
jgi:hypothetical protein